MNELTEIISKAPNDAVALQIVKQWIKKNQKRSLHLPLDHTPVTSLTPVMAAASRGFLETVKYFLNEKKVSPNEINFDNHTALDNALIEGQVETAEYLVHETKCFEQDGAGNTSLYLASARNQHTLLSNIIERAGQWIICAPNKSLATPLHIAAQNNAVESVEILLSHGALGNVYDIQGCTPLALAILMANKHVIEHLLNSEQVCPILINPILPESNVLSNLLTDNNPKITHSEKKSILELLLLAGLGVHPDYLPKGFEEYLSLDPQEKYDFILLGKYVNDDGITTIHKITDIETLSEKLKDPRWCFQTNAIARACSHPGLKDSSTVQRIVLALELPIPEFKHLPESYYTAAVHFPPPLITHNILQKTEYPNLYCIASTLKMNAKGSINFLGTRLYYLYNQNDLKTSSLSKTCVDTVLTKFMSELTSLLQLALHDRYRNSLFADFIEPQLVAFNVIKQMLLQYFNKRKDNEFHLRILIHYANTYKFILKKFNIGLSKNFPLLLAKLVNDYVITLIDLTRIHLILENFDLSIFYGEEGLKIQTSYFSKNASDQDKLKKCKEIIHGILAQSYLSHRWFNEAAEHLISYINMSPQHTYYIELIISIAIPLKNELFNAKKYDTLSFLLNALEDFKKNTKINSEQKNFFDNISQQLKICDLLWAIQKAACFSEKISENEYGRIDNDENNLYIFLLNSSIHSNNKEAFLRLLSNFPKITYQEDNRQLTIPILFFLHAKFTRFETRFRKILSIKVPSVPIENSNKKNEWENKFETVQQQLENLILDNPKPPKIKTRGIANLALAKNTLLQDVVKQEEPDVGFNISPEYFPPLPINIPRKPPNRYFITMPNTDEFSPFFSLFKKEYIPSIDAKGKGQQGVKISAYKTHDKNGRSQKTFMAKLKVLGENGHLRAGGCIKREIYSKNGETQSLFVIDTVTTKDQEKRRRNYR